LLGNGDKNLITSFTEGIITNLKGQFCFTQKVKFWISSLLVAHYESFNPVVPGKQGLVLFFGANLSGYEPTPFSGTTQNNTPVTRGVCVCVCVWVGG